MKMEEKSLGVEGFVVVVFCFDCEGASQ